MTIIEALQKNDSLRIINGDKWLVYNQHNKIWVVYEKKRRAHHTQELVSTLIEEDAVRILLAK